jgi:hypothetical protein
MGFQVLQKLEWSPYITPVTYKFNYRLETTLSRRFNRPNNSTHAELLPSQIKYVHAHKLLSHGSLKQRILKHLHVQEKQTDVSHSPLKFTIHLSINLMLTNGNTSIFMRHMMHRKFLRTISNNYCQAQLHSTCLHTTLKNG